jgi:hypothetical protein
MFTSGRRILHHTNRKSFVEGEVFTARLCWSFRPFPLLV